MQTRELRGGRLRRTTITVAFLAALLCSVPAPALASEGGQADSPAPGTDGSYGTTSLFAEEGAVRAAREARKANASGNSRIIGALLGEIAKSSDTVHAEQEEAAAELLERQRLEEEARRAEEEARAAQEAAQREADLRGSVADVALGYLGVPYASGGTTPSGFDCSGLVRYCVLQACGVELPRTAAAQSTAGYGVSFDELVRGDLLFWGGYGNAWHVGIYLGDGSYVHAPAPGQTVSVDTFQYFAPSFARRLSL